MRRPGRIPNRAKTKRSRLDRDADTSWMTEDDKQADFMAGIDFGGIVQGVPANQCVQLDGEVVRMESERLENDAIRTSHAPNCRSDLDEEPLLLFSAVLEEAIFVADAFGSFLEDLDESHEEEECSSIDDADPFYEIDDERSEDIVCHDAIAERTQMSYTVCLAASLSTSIYKRLSAAFFEEDDAIAAAAVRKTEKGVTVEGAAKAADEVNLAAQHVAVAAAQDAADSATTGCSASADVASGSVTPAIIEPSTLKRVSVAVLAVAALFAAVLAAGLVMAGRDVPLVYPDVSNPAILEGRIAINFRGAEGRLTLDQAGVLESMFASSYNDVFGCDSVYSRRVLNCTIPCEEGTNSAQRCCNRANDTLFGDVLQCPFECFVHCDGCPVNEPLFSVASSNETIFPTLPPICNITVGDEDATTETNAPTRDPMANFSSCVQVLIADPIACSPQCLVARNVERLVCGSFYSKSDNCVAVRSETFDSSSSGDKVEKVTLVPAPLAFPSMSPGSSPGVTSTPLASPSMSPSRSPGVMSTPRPSLRTKTTPSAKNSEGPIAVPTSEPSQGPSAFPAAVGSSRGPSPGPSTRPSKGPIAVRTAKPAQGTSAFPTAVGSSRSPSPGPSTRPSKGPIAVPTAKPVQGPSAFPTAVGSSRSPTAGPSTRPSNGLFEELILFDGKGNELGSLQGMVIVLSEVGSSLTVEARVQSSLVNKVEFYFDDEFVGSEGEAPYYINSDSLDVGIAFSPLAELGDHWITAVAKNHDGALMGTQTSAFTTVN